MPINLTDTEGGVIFCPSGDVVAESEPELRASLRSLASAGVKNIVVDLKNVQMMDSAGLGLLVAVHNSLRKSGGQLSVIHASAALLELFQSMRMHQHFNISGLESD
jgi:anti-anti-sigma factor